MRTDGLHVSPAAVKELRAVADAEFGAAYVPKTPNYYKKKQKNAQEAHGRSASTSAAVLPEAQWRIASAPGRTRRGSIVSSGRERWRRRCPRRDQTRRRRGVVARR